MLGVSSGGVNNTRNSWITSDVRDSTSRLCSAVGFLEKLHESGDGFLRELDGRFVVGILDREEQTLRVILNRYGLTLCFRTTGKYGIAVGTRIAPLLDLVGRPRMPNRAGLVRMFLVGGCFGPPTPFEGVFQLDPGQEIILKEGDQPLQERCYTPFETIIEKRKEVGKDYLRIGSEAMTAVRKKGRAWK